MNNRPYHLLIVSLIALFILLACNIPGASVATEVPMAPQAPQATQLSPTEIPTNTPIPTATPIQHKNVPEELPTERSSQAGDQDSSVSALQQQALGGDRFTFGRFERPFNANTMDVYFPYLDIQDTLVYRDDTWVFAVITLKNGDENGKLPGRYGFEIDTNVDGGGDWLILADSPASTDWSTQGVQVWFDTNDDVGGQTTINTDEHPLDGNGYETLVFDQDQGDDPDLAWVRIAPDDSNTVQLAVKRSILAGDDSFMAGMWAGKSILDPAKFDLNDHFTHEQAGAALRDLEYFYPIKAVSELDNSCRIAVGFAPTGSEPGSCPTAPEQPGPGEACPSQQYYCFNTGSQRVCVCIGQ